MNFMAALEQALAESAHLQDGEAAPHATVSKEALRRLPKVSLTAESDMDRRVLSNQRTLELKQRLTALAGKSATHGLLEKGDLVAAVAGAARAQAARRTASEGARAADISQLFNGDQDRTCTLCFDEFGVGDIVTRLPCGHWFHAGESEGEGCTAKNECPGVTKWLSIHGNSCPNCKTIVPEGCEHSSEDSVEGGARADDGPWPIPSEVFAASAASTYGSPTPETLDTMPCGQSASTVKPVFVKGQAVEYCGAGGAWEPATVLQVGFDGGSEPYYTVALGTTGRERGTVTQRLRLPRMSSRVHSREAGERDESASCQDCADDDLTLPVPAKRARSI